MIVADVSLAHVVVFGVMAWLFIDNMGLSHKVRQLEQALFETELYKHYQQEKERMQGKVNDRN